ncbi:MAG: translation initiation factor IF-3 [Candidatus Babeliaceae bacterium]|nr:translation initiation factor IF-3 [Candidatus Babeliaceae bacterium]
MTLQEREKQKKSDIPLANEKIRFDEMQLIDQDGVNRGVVGRRQALAAAQEARLDLVLIAERGSEGVPVVKIMDLGKELYRRKQQVKEAKKKQHVIQVKEIKLRPKIAGNDFLTKMKQAARFLEEGKHVRVTLMFRGREAAMRDESGRALFDRVNSTLEELLPAGKSVVAEGEIQTNNLWSRVYTPKKT